MEICGCQAEQIRNVIPRYLANSMKLTINLLKKIEVSSSNNRMPDVHRPMWQTLIR